MMRNRTSAMPSDRIQLSNQRARRERPGWGGGRGTGAVRALVPAVGAPNSCMPVTLAKLSRRRNGSDPSRGSGVRRWGGRADRSPRGGGWGGPGGGRRGGGGGGGRGSVVGAACEPRHPVGASQINPARDARGTQVSVSICARCSFPEKST